MRHEHEWVRYFSATAKWDGTYRYRCIKCRECVESYTGAIPAIEAKLPAIEAKLPAIEAKLREKNRG